MPRQIAPVRLTSTRFVISLRRGDLRERRLAELLANRRRRFAAEEERREELRAQRLRRHRQEAAEKEGCRRHEWEGVGLEAWEQDGIRDAHRAAALAALTGTRSTTANIVTSQQVTAVATVNTTANVQVTAVANCAIVHIANSEANAAAPIVENRLSIETTARDDEVIDPRPRSGTPIGRIHARIPRPEAAVVEGRRKSKLPSRELTFVERLLTSRQESGTVSRRRLESRSKCDRGFTR